MKNAGFDILPSTVAGHDGIVIAYVGQLQTEDLKKKTMEKLDLAVKEIIRVVLPVPITDEKNSYDNEDEQSGDHRS